MRILGLLLYSIAHIWGFADKYPLPIVNFVYLHRKDGFILSIIDDVLSYLDKNGLKQSDLCNHIGINTSTMTNWKNRKTDPPAKYIIPICEFLDVSPYVLLTGKEKSLSEVKLTDDEQELLTYYKDLDELEKALILGEAKGIYMAAKMLVKQPEKAIITESNDTPKLQRAYMVSRSTDNTPPRFVEGDFSDILNAPDVTDEY